MRIGNGRIDDVQIEKAAMVIRARTGWEAVDLGFRMAQHWSLPIYTAWLCLLLPVVALSVAAFPGSPFIVLVIAYWLRPLMERPVLHVLSRAAFGTVPSAREAVRSVFEPGTLVAATIGRLGPLRPYTGPVRVVERLGGAALFRRMRLIGRGQIGSAVWLTFCCALFELVLAAGAVALVLLFVPDSVQASPDQWADGNMPVWTRWLAVSALLLAMTLIGPLYVGGGFALYLNRRVHVEGWDIELTFSRLARRLAGSAVLVAALVTCLPIAARAEDDLDRASRTADRILEDEDFGGTRTERRWQLRDRGEPDKPSRDFDQPAGAGVGEVLANVLLWVLGFALVLALVLVLASRKSLLDEDDAEEEADQRLPEEVRVYPMDAGILPSDVVGAAEARWAAGDRAGALALLYRGGLASIVERRGLEIPRSATEGECLSLAVGRLGEAEGRSFRAVVLSWQSAAFADRPPDDEAFRGLCRQWTAAFRGADGGAQ